MSPKAYRNAREQAKTPEEIVVIDDRPYAPLAVIDPTQEDTVKQIAAQIMLHPVNNNNNHAIEKGETWKKLSVQKVAGGITNILFLVSGWRSHYYNNVCSNGSSSTTTTSSSSSSLPDAVLVRIFGAEGMIDRDLENATFAALARCHNIAPAYFGRFANGRIEAYLTGFRHLQVHELSHPTLVPGIAKALAEMHQKFQLPVDLQDYYPFTKPSMWTQLQDWLDQSLRSISNSNSSNNKFLTKHDQERAASLELASIPQELHWLKTQLPPTASIVFCHNDLLAANIMYHEEQDIFQLIDFEYGGINYRSFDIANHFSEFAGGPPCDAEPDYSLLPSKTVQRDFIRAYLRTISSSSSSSDATAAVATTTTEGSSKKENEETAVTELFHEVQGFAMATHLYWGLWAVNQAATEGCEEYDYMLYAQNRIRQYWICKQEWCTEALSSLQQ